MQRIRMREPRRAEALVRSLPGNYALCREVADALGVTRKAVNYHALTHPELHPTHGIDYAGVTIVLYTGEDVELVRKALSSPKPGRRRVGRPRVWSLEEGRDRHRRGDLARWYRRRAAVLSEEGLMGEASAALARAGEIMAELDAQRVTRMNEIAQREAAHAADGQHGTVRANVHRLASEMTPA